MFECLSKIFIVEKILRSSTSREVIAIKFGKFCTIGEATKQLISQSLTKQSMGEGMEIFTQNLVSFKQDKF